MSGSLPLATAMLQLDLRPGDGLGPFKIGASLWSIIALVREPHSKTLFPSVKVVYDTASPSNTAIIVHLHPYIDLLFSGKGQRLHTIAIRHLRHGLPTSPKQAPQPLGMAVGSATSSSKSRGGGSSLILRYKHTIISSPDEVLRRAGVMKSFGPTYEGDVMKYPGVSFIFEDDASAALLRSPRLSADENKRVEVKKISITQRTVGDEVDAFDEVLESPVMDGDLRSVVLKVHEGIDLYFYPSTSSSSTLRLGEATAEDIRHELGDPINTYYKEDDRIAIHGTSAHDESSPNSYFMNYFQHGIDFFMDGSTHVLKKIILHSNVVGSPHFQRYQRCPWKIAESSSPSDDNVVSCLDSLEDIKSFLGRSSAPSQPMELDRSEDYEALSTPASFTRLIGFDGIILETTTSGQVTTVTLY